MRRLSKYLLFFLIIFSIASVSLKAADDKEQIIIANPGEDASTEMNISFFTNSENAYVSYYADFENENNAKLVQVTDYSQSPFTNNAISANITLSNLVPNTLYHYQIIDEGKSNWHSFKTAGGYEFSFAHVTDIHSWISGGANNRVSAANSVLNKINETKELDFVLFSGDMTAYGTVYDQWRDLYNMDVVRDKMIATTPGNHDYYNTSAVTQHIGYYNAVHNNPKNGALGVENSSYYFKYNNTLFISINSEAADYSVADRNSQIKWINEVTANNPSDFIIAFAHRPFYTGDGQNAGQARNMVAWFQEIFDHTGVDLALVGHNHVYARSYQVYDDKQISGVAEGTRYITGIQIGDRYKTEPGIKHSLVEVAHLGANQNGGNLITVTKDKIYIEFIKQDGTRLYPFTIDSKSEFIDKETIEASIEATKVYDSVKITYDRPKAGLIKKIEASYGDIILETYLNPGYEMIILNDPPKIYKFPLTLRFLLRNGEEITKTINVFDEDYNYGYFENLRVKEYDYYSELEWDAEINSDLADHYELFLDGVFYKEIALSETSTILDSISPYKINNLSLRLVNKNKEVLASEEIVYGEKGSPLILVFNYDNISVTAGEEISLEYTIHPNQELLLEFTSSDESIATVDNNGVVRGLKEGTVTIKVNVAKRWEVFSEVTLKVLPGTTTPDPGDEGPNDIIPDEPVKKGCFTSSYIFTGLGVLGVTYLFRRKRY